MRFIYSDVGLLPLISIEYCSYASIEQVQLTMDILKYAQKNIVNGALFDYNAVRRKISAVFNGGLVRLDMYLEERGEHFDQKFWNDFAETDFVFLRTDGRSRADYVRLDMKDSTDEELLELFNSDT
jgi:hypothetical protein